jgi:hypothetical protein
VELPNLLLPLLISQKKQAHLEPGIACSGFTACRNHDNQHVIGSELQHGLPIFSTEQGKLLSLEPQNERKWLRRLGMKGNGWLGYE